MPGWLSVENTRTHTHLGKLIEAIDCMFYSLSDANQSTCSMCLISFICFFLFLLLFVQSCVFLRSLSLLFFFFACSAYCQGNGLTSVSGPCAAGFYCLGGSQIASPQSANVGGYSCPRSYYCEAGTPAPVPCPAGSKRTTKRTGGVGAT